MRPSFILFKLICYPDRKFYLLFVHLVYLHPRFIPFRFSSPLVNSSTTHMLHSYLPLNFNWFTAFLRLSAPCATPNYHKPPNLNIIRTFTNLHPLAPTRLHPIPPTQLAVKYTLVILDNHRTNLTYLTVPNKLMSLMQTMHPMLWTSPLLISRCIQVCHLTSCFPLFVNNTESVLLVLCLSNKWPTIITSISIF